MPPLEFELLPGARLRFKPAPLQCQPFHLLLSADEGGTHPASATGSTRLHEIIARVGEICLSPELARIMSPIQPAQPATTITSSSINMETTPASLRQSAKQLADLQARCMPKPTLVTLRQPLHLAAWRVETSPRVCLFTGTGQDISSIITEDKVSICAHARRRAAEAALIIIIIIIIIIIVIGSVVTYVYETLC